MHAAPIFKRTDIPLDTSAIPEVIYDEDHQLVDLYNTAWEIAWNHVFESSLAVSSPYMSEGFDSNCIWIWDTCLMSLFCKYAPDIFPGIESLDNFYHVMHGNRELHELRVHHPDNPPLFAWVEYEYFKLTEDYSRLENIIYKHQFLQKHYQYLDTLTVGQKFPYANVHALWKKLDDGYMWSGTPSGMDNTPRGNYKYNMIYWLDAPAQQGLAALSISKIAAVLNDNKLENYWKLQYENLCKITNRTHWCEEEGFYFDKWIFDDQFCKVVTPASFWPMLAEMSSSGQAACCVEKLKDSSQLGGFIPCPTVSRSDPEFSENGAYWKGSVWLPTTYMTVKSLEKYGMFDLAYGISRTTLEHMKQTWLTFSPHTIWECYSPCKNEPALLEDGHLVRKDFCGWSALGPISLLIENVLGFYDIDASKNLIKWNLKSKHKHGIKNLKFGRNIVSVVSDTNVVHVFALKPFTLVVNGHEYKISSGDSYFSISEFESVVNTV